MKSEVKKDIKNCACDLFHCALAGTAIIGSCILSWYFTKYDTKGLFYECLGSATGVVIGGGCIIAVNGRNLSKHIKELKQHLKE